MSSDGSEYRVELFNSEGFTRKKCVKCGKHYWTLDSDRTTCGDAPCDEYGFIGSAPTKKSLSLHEMREKYLSFFERNNHTRINRYPIVARWRNDVFFTQASIYCFQPWVINRVVKPPANPLTISQTCVRFNDIDNVGKTGRHFTMFEMMAHHCFNTKEQQIYFKDRTVELCYRLISEELSIDPLTISFIEADWAGGGNSGPCFETLVSGIELSTLVFMMYKEEDGVKKEMDMQVVDTGYGLERFTWITQGTSSAYEAVFGSVLEKLKKEARITGDEKILGEYSRVAGLMNVESNADLKVLRKKVAERLGITTEKLASEIDPMENLYAVCDHSRALAFMLQDGVLPSNVKEGYFARMLVRRSIRALDRLGLKTTLADIVGMQIDYFKKDFPELSENREDLLKLAEVEEDKYRKTIEKGRSIVSRADEKIKSEGKTALDLPNLISLYDSQGLTPDLVKEFSSLEVDVPDDFYIKVAESHTATGGKQEEGEEKKDEIKVPQGTAPTTLGYYTDPATMKFEATVADVFCSYVILDKTYFYPEGGGQETDLGTIEGLPVSFVHKVGNVVVHEIRGDISKIKKGRKASCHIDEARRKQLSAHHTATHIVNGAARRTLGSHVWQTGAHKSTASARLDITHYQSLSKEELEKIEALANKIVSENRPVSTTFMERVAAESKYGFRLYQGGVVPGGEIRVVDVKDWDTEACGGIHARQTGDVGTIRITGSKRIQDGVVRLEFAAGPAAEKYASEQKKIAENIAKGSVSLSEKDLARIAAVFSVPVAQLTKTLERFRDEWQKQTAEIESLEKKLSECACSSHAAKYKEMPSGDSYDDYVALFEGWKNQRKDLESLKDELAQLFENQLCEKLEKDHELIEGAKVVKLLASDMNVKSLSETLKKAAEKESCLIIAVNACGEKANVVVASSCGFNASEVAKKLSSALGGGGHGDAKLAIGGGSSKDAQKALSECKP